MTKIEKIKCDNCGQIRRWKGAECLDTCPCLNNEESNDVYKKDNRSREIDTLVAEQVMGVVVNGYKVPKSEYDDFPASILFPNYSTDIREAWKVWELLRESGIWCCLKISSDYHYVYDVVLIKSDGNGDNPKHKPTIIASSENICKAICLAALRTKGINKI